jgi:hypothetical protein
MARPLGLSQHCELPVAVRILPDTAGCVNALLRGSPATVRRSGLESARRSGHEVVH